MRRIALCIAASALLVTGNATSSLGAGTTSALGAAGTPDTHHVGPP